MNDQQFASLLLACALVMIPLGIALALGYRQLREWLGARLSPRFLRPLPDRQRRPGTGDGAS